MKWLRLPDEPEGQCAWDGKMCQYAAEATVGVGMPGQLQHVFDRGVDV